MKKWTIPFNWNDGIPVFDVEGRQFIMDTGSPATIGSDVHLCGRTARASSLLLSMVGERFLPEWADGLVGLDFINSFTTTVDAEQMTVTFTEGDTQPAGTAVDLLPAFYPGAPFVPVEIGGQRLRAYVDTGSTLTYVGGELLTHGPEVGQWDDYHPIVGDFHTSVHRLAAGIGGEAMELECGEMPGMIGLGLQAMGADLLIGGELLRQRRVTFAPADSKLFLETYH